MMCLNKNIFFTEQDVCTYCFLGFDHFNNNIYIYRNLFNGSFRVFDDKLRKWYLLVGVDGPIKLFSQFKCSCYTRKAFFFSFKNFVFWCQNDTNYDRYGVTKFTMEFNQYLFEIPFFFLSLSLSRSLHIGVVVAAVTLSSITSFF